LLSVEGERRENLAEAATLCCQRTSQHCPGIFHLPDNYRNDELFASWKGHCPLKMASEAAQNMDGDERPSMFYERASMYYVQVANIFEISHYDKFRTRTLALLPLFPDLFLFGGGMGTLVGHSLVHIEFVDGFPTLSRQEIFHACAYFLAIFLGSGTTWQRIVNDTIRYGMNFTEAFFYVWLMCFLLFLTVLTTMRALNTQYTQDQLFKLLKVKSKFMTIHKRFYFDVQLALSVSLSDAFFVGTETSELEDNWLAPAFGIYDDTSKPMAMIKSGLSTLAGFLVLQVVQNAILKDCWIDPMEDLTTHPRPTEATRGTQSTEGVTMKDVTESPLPHHDV
jgi:hypothetical protein